MLWNFQKRDLTKPHRISRGLTLRYCTLVCSKPLEPRSWPAEHLEQGRLGLVDVQPLVDVAEEASGACLGLQCTRTHTVLIPSELRITVQSQLVSGCDEKHRRHRNRKFERWLEPNPAPTTITPFVSVYTLHMPPAETLVISLETAAATKNEWETQKNRVSIFSLAPINPSNSHTSINIPSNNNNHTKRRWALLFWRHLPRGIIFHVCSRPRRRTLSRGLAMHSRNE